MKKNRMFVLTALVLVSVFAFASCVQGADDMNETTKPTEEMATDKPTDEDMKDDNDMTDKDNTDEDMANEESKDDMDSSMTFEGDAFNFDLVDLQGNSYKLSDLQGKKVYVKFWASWCSICLAGISEFEELYATFEDDDGVLVLSVVSPGASGEMSSEKFKQWFETQGYKFDVLLDDAGPVMREYGIRGFPTSVFIDTMGNVADTKIGHVDNATVESTLSDMS